MNLRPRTKSSSRFDDYILDMPSNRSHLPTNENTVNVNQDNNDTHTNESDYTNTLNENIKIINPDNSVSIEVSPDINNENEVRMTEGQRQQTVADQPSLFSHDVITPTTATVTQPLESSRRLVHLDQPPIHSADVVHTHSNEVIHPPQSLSTDADIQPVWLTLLFYKIEQSNINLAHKMELNNDVLSAKIDKMESNNNDLANRIKINNTELKQANTDLANKISRMDSQINQTIKSYVTTLDAKISTLTNTVTKNTEEIKTIQESCRNVDNKIHQVRNETKAELFKTITDLQRHTTEVVVDQCNILEDRVTTQINVLNDKITVVEETHSTTINKLKHDIYNQITDTIENNQIMKLHQLKIDHHDTQLNKISETLDKNKDQLINQGQIPNIYVNCLGNSNHNLDQPLPKFNGRTNNVSDFIRKLHKYYERSLSTMPNKNPNEHLIDLIELALENHAAKWFNLIKQDINSWEDFESAFLLKYWSRESQRAIKHRIETETYRDDGPLNRAEYFVEKVITLRSIMPPMSDEEIIICLTCHFNCTIQDSIRVQNIRTIKEFELLLQREDLRTQHTRTRPCTSSRPNPAYSSPPRPRGYQPATSRPSNQQQFDRRMPPTNHQAYPPRQNGYSYDNQPRPAYNQRSHPYSPRPNYREDNRGEPRRQHSPHRRYEPHAAVILRDSPSRRYPSEEQRQTCSSIRDRHSTPSHTP